MSNQQNMDDLVKALLQLRHACKLIGGDGPKSIVVDHATADFIQYASRDMAHVHDPKRGTHPNYVGRIVGIEVYTPTDRREHAVDNLRRIVDDQ